MVTSHVGSSYGGGAMDQRLGPAPAEALQKKSAPANCGPMTQQGTMGAHGHEMHPQGFLRLIGCHEAGRHKEGAAQRLHA